MSPLYSPRKYCQEVMLSDDMPGKLQEIIRDQWPNIFRPHKDWKPPSKRRVDNKKKT